MSDKFGGPKSILNNDQSKGLVNFLKQKGWLKKKHGYNYVNVKGTFFGGLFKERLFEVVMKNNDIEIYVLHNDIDGKLGVEFKYKVKVGDIETKWIDIKDYEDIQENIRENKIDNLLN